MKHVMRLSLFWLSILSELYAQDSAVLVTRKGSFALDIKIARSVEEKTRGYMHSKSISDHEGMLFLYGGSPQTRCYWMANTFVPLDILHFDAAGVVIDITKGMVPQSRETRCSKAPAVASLEVQGGSVQKYMIQKGDKLIHDSFK